MEDRIMKINSLNMVGGFGQSIWLDYIRRDLIASGELGRLIREDALKGMTSNPAIFEKAITGSNLYDADIRKMALQHKEIKEIYESLSQQDIQNAADVFRPVYEKTSGEDGYVSLEVNPHLAHSTKGSIQEGRRLWSLLKRPNVFIKIPATTEGLIAIRQLISNKINVNVTLIFSLTRYRQVAEAYLEGLEACVAKRSKIDQITSVASFFLSRIDTLVDSELEKIIESDSNNKDLAKETLGEVAISSAKAAYQIYKEIFNSPRFKKLEEKGAHVQRLLWASTSNKNPAYSDVKYIEALIGPKTVTTVPLDTINAYRDHGNPKSRLEQDIEKANRILKNLTVLGIDIDQATHLLENEGIQKFNEPFDKLMDALKKKASA